MGKIESHDLVAAIKDIAIELGYTPSRSQFEFKVKGGKYQLEKQFGTYTALIQAAGLEPKSSLRPSNIDNTVFEKDLAAHLEKYKPKEAPTSLVFPTMAVISDIHWPFECARVIEKFLKYVEEFKPAYVLINGDAWDFYSHSRYPRSHNIFTPREEQRLSRERNEQFWKDVKARSPGSKCIQMLGNHCIRPLKRVLESYPAAEDWIEEKLKELFTYDGVETIYDPRQELDIDGILIFHGYRSKLGDHRNYTLRSCVNGHTHRGGVVWRNVRGEILFEANSGVAGEPESKGLSYTSQKVNDWTPGFLGVDEWGPRFIPA